ncbi:hypothetical protein HKT18_00745 [Flavobacterium sp. IMCC34852]|uniref:TonB C-terminal domain-containing protein n=1 Tax=Flavobacterium rivulicola TaxID=2732161 RepID=A0A7Y3R718_9FLAO|nr:hypothetical protein [Flavobacterium sp. IMCC34852]NNT70731.1 hypothetical protein [Flavobacterium sp. IMCC34852]
MKKALALLLLTFSFSCQYLEKKAPSEQELLNQQIKEINWKEVDEYPSVADCEKLTDAAQRKQCFFDFLTATIEQKLAIDTLATMFPKLDTIEVRVTILPDATLEFNPEFPKDSVAYDTIKIDSILRARLIGFPKVNPALKRGIPVKTQFVLPVIIKQE